jgi:hypothetical protein
MVIINLDNLKLWFQTCEQQVAFFFINNYWCLYMGIWQNFPALRYVALCHYLRWWLLALSWKIMLHAINNTNYFECVQGISFCEYKRCYLSKCYCWRGGMVKHGRTTRVLVHHVIFCMFTTKLTHIWRLFLLYYVVCCVGSLL